MWLLPALNAVSAAALRIFYRLEIAGDPPPARGAVLLVANHPNSLVDPGAVAAVAERPVRFLAKAPLFTDLKVGWLIRASGSIPVYRRTDDPDLVGRNEDTFRAVHDALAEGSAIGIFPEGLSHSEPALAPLRTGAARIALGAADRVGGAFPIVPVGLSFREKGRFRSEALAMIGRPVPWDDLRARAEDPEAVRELTTRIEQGLREVTVNLESWEDAPLVETAEEIYRAELGAGGGAGAAVARMAQLGDALARLRADDRGGWRELASDVRGHARLLRRLRIRPQQLDDPGPGAAIRWVPRQALWLAALGLPAAAGALLYAVPYLATSVVGRAAGAPPDVRATYKLLTGAALHLLWTLLAAVAVGAVAGAGWGLATLVLMPLAGLAALVFHDRWRRAEGEAHRFFLRARRGEVIAELRERQRGLAARMEELREALSTPPVAPAHAGTPPASPPAGEDPVRS